MTAIKSRRGAGSHRAVFTCVIVAALVALSLAPSASAEVPTPPTEGELSSLTLTGVDGTTRVWQGPTDSVGYGIDSSTHLLTAGATGAAGDASFTFAAPSPDTTYTRWRAGSFPASDYPWQAPGVAGISGTVGPDCEHVEGHIWMIDFSPDVGRVWLQFEEHCPGTLGHGVFGDLQVNIVPGEGAGVSVAPPAIHWPDQYLGLASPSVPVTVTNTGSSPFTVYDARVAAGGDDFSVTQDGCTALLDPGDSCQVTIGFTPTVGGDRLGSLRLDTSTTTEYVSLAGRGDPGRTFFTAHSDPGDPIGLGEDYEYTPTDETSIVTGSSRGLLSARIQRGNELWKADFAAPTGEEIVPGKTYDDVVGYPAGTPADKPAMSVVGNASGCAPGAGSSFTVDEATFRDDGRPSSYLVHFVQQCAGFDGALHGTIAWRATNPDAPARDDTAPHPASGVTLSYHYYALHVGWSNPEDADWADTVVRVAPGAQAPATPDSGREVYTGRGSAAFVDVGPTKTGYSVSAFARDTSGNVARVATAFIPGSTVVLEQLSTPVPWGHQVELHGRVTDSVTGDGIYPGIVTIERWDWDTVSWVSAGQAVKDLEGYFLCDITPTAGTQYRALFSDDATHVDETSEPIDLQVAPAVTLSADHRRVRVHRPVVLTTSTEPARPGATVTLQRRSGGIWRAVATATFDVGGQASFTRRPRPGRQRFRTMVLPWGSTIGGVSPVVQVRVVRR
jgi:hypothetical protein